MQNNDDNSALPSSEGREEHRRCHDLVCNGDWSKPRGEGSGCSCRGRESRAAEECNTLREQLTQLSDALTTQSDLLLRERKEHTGQLLQLEPLAKREKCEKCRTLVPPSMIAVEVKGGAPIDDPAGFMWCVVCHSRRVVDETREQLTQLRGELDRVKNDLFSPFSECLCRL